MTKSGRPPSNHKTATRLAHSGRDSAGHHGAVNVPVYRASTILFPSHEAYQNGEAHPYDTYQYGRTLTPSSDALERAVAELENGYRSISVSSGAAACATAILAHVKAGQHLLMVDSAYGPTRRLCDTLLAAMGVETTYYDPLIGAGIAGLVRPNTAVIYLETPGSLTFEMQDVPAIVAVAKARGVTTILDNTWASPLFYKPLDHGVDVSVQAGTKYISGHADVLIGLITLPDATAFRRVKRVSSVLGQQAGPDDVYLTLRGLRTLGVRLPHHQRSALQVATWLAERPEVERVLYPPLPDDPGHTIWARDFSGASGLMGMVLADGATEAGIRALVDGLDLFGIGSSWGGFESLVLWTRPERTRSATPWAPVGRTLRLHIGLEDVGDLIADLDAGFARLNAAG